MIDTGSVLWRYMSETQRLLALDGSLLLEDRKKNPNEKLSDYSYLVFPYAKLYEGFLKRLFLDLRVITEREYQSQHFRLGKVLSPNLISRLRTKSAFGQIQHRFGQELAYSLWNTWKQGRNMVFHYFPHNVRRLSFDEALHTIEMIVSTMTEAVSRTNPHHEVPKSSLAWGKGSGVSKIYVQKERNPESRAPC